MKRGICVLFVAACGGGSAATPDARPPDCALDGGAACFQLPSAVLVAHDGSVAGAPALGCGPFVPTDSTMDVMVSGTIKNYSGGAGVAGVTLDVASDPGITSVLASATTASDGTYSLTIPSGSTDLLFARLTATGYADVEYGNLHEDYSQPTITDDNLSIATTGFLDTLFSIVNATRDPTKANVALTARDCSGSVLQHAAIVLSSTSGSRTFIPGASVFYTAAGSFPVPEAPDLQPDTNDNGAGAVVNVPTTGPAYLQVWGWPDANAQAQGEAGLVLIGEDPLTVTAGELLGDNVWAQ